jgi:hypothetical protein
LKIEMGDSIAMVNYHTYGPDTTEFFNNEDANARVSYYGIGYVPTAIFNGIKRRVGGWSHNYEEYRDSVNQQLTVNTPGVLTLDLRYDYLTRTGKVYAMFHSVDQIVEPNLHLRYAITESHMYRPWGGGSAPRLDSLQFIEREMLPSDTGVAFTINQGDTYADSQSFHIDPTWVAGNCNLVVWVQSDVSTYLKKVLISNEIPVVPGGNLPPTAYLDDISPNPAGQGDNVTFSAHGTDADGLIIAYQWRSSIDGYLSNQASFSSSGLSVGRHTIYFKVQDDDSLWSSEVSAILEIKRTECYSYQQRYAIIVMGGNVTDQTYQRYWEDTRGMYQDLISYGFTGNDIYFLSYGDSADAHPDWVDAVSSTAAIIAAFQWVQIQCTSNDLLYIYWVDHGTTTAFETNDGTITHSQLGNLMQPIVAKVIIGAYNPSYSGCVMDDVSQPGVITVTSQDCFNPNSWGWAGMWRRALNGAPEDSIDANGDGYISMTEAYNWIAPRSQAAGEHSEFDDNGDGVGHEWGQSGYNPADLSQDGYNGKFYSLHNWCRSFLLGDSNGDGVIDIGDVVYDINYLFKSGPMPNPLLSGDANCDSVDDVGDVVYLINYLFKNGPAPSC